MTRTMVIYTPDREFIIEHTSVTLEDIHRHLRLDVDDPEFGSMTIEYGGGRVSVPMSVLQSAIIRVY